MNTPTEPPAAGDTGEPLTQKEFYELSTDRQRYFAKKVKAAAPPVPTDDGDNKKEPVKAPHVSTSDVSISGTGPDDIITDIRRYVAALAESGDNFMKPDNVSQETRDDYVISIKRLFDRYVAEAVRRGQPSEQQFYDTIYAYFNEQDTYGVSRKNHARDLAIRLSELAGQAEEQS